MSIQNARDQSVTMTYFPFLRDWIATFLEENKDMTASLIGHNMLVEQVCRIYALTTLITLNAN